MDRLTFRYDVPAERDGDAGRVYLVRRGTVRADVPAPSTPEEHAALDVLAARVFHGPDPRGDDVPMHDLDEFYLVASWFRRRPEELARTTTVPPG
jgi:excinuclease ABC subunit C